MMYQETSRQAFEWFKEHCKGAVDKAILKELNGAGSEGLTCDAIETKTGLSHQTCSGNLRHLVEANVVKPTSKRMTVRSGRLAIAWVAAWHYDKALHDQQASDASTVNLPTH